MEEILPLPEALQTRLAALVDSAYADVQANASAEQKAASERLDKQLGEDKEQFGLMMMNMNADFEAADVNQDGVLDAAESRVFIQKMDERDRAEGRYANATDAQMDEIYAIANAINSDYEGYNFMEDWLIVSGNFVKLWMAKSAASQ